VKNNIPAFEKSLEQGLRDLSALHSGIQKDVIEITFEDLKEIHEADDGALSGEVAKQAYQLASAVRNAITMGTSEVEILSRIEYDVRLHVRGLRGRIQNVVPISGHREMVA